MNRKLTTQDISYIAIGVALIAICSWLSIPMTVPFTMQTFAVCLITALFGFRRGLWTVICYILLGAVGAPIFSGFRGGFGVLLGTTGGYIVGFIFTALIVGAAVEKLGRRFPVLIASMAVGILVCYVFGTVWFMVVYAKTSGAIGIGTALMWCVIPYLVPDAVKIFLASILVRRLYPLMNRKGRMG